MSGIGQKIKGTVRELKDVLVVMHIWNMMGYSVLVVEYTFVQREKANDQVIFEII